MMQRYLCALIGVLVVGLAACAAQDYDDEGYGNQGGNNQGEGDNYNNGYGNEDNYNGNMPNYQQNVDSESSNNQPSSYSPQSGSDADGDYEGDDGSAAAASAPQPSVVRVRRSAQVETESIPAAAPSAGLESLSSEPKLRVKRHGKYYIGPVYTYVKTDKHANFKWGVSILFDFQFERHNTFNYVNQ